MTSQILPSDEPFKNVRGFPREKDMAAKVLPLPELVKGKVICDAIAPCQEEGKIVKFAIEPGRGKFLKTKNLFSVLDYEGEPFDGIHIEDKYLPVVNAGHRMVVKDAEEKPIMLAAQEKIKINKAYFIMSKTPLFDGDASIEEEDGVPFYPMFKVRDIDDNHPDFRSILIWNGHNYQVFLQAALAARMPDQPGGHLVPPCKNDLLILDPKDRETVYCVMSKRSIKERERMAGWDVVVSPGADVGMCMILAVIMDDMVGWFR